MKKTLWTLLSTFALTLAVGCGDNFAEEPDIGQLPGQDGDVLIVPQQDKILDAVSAAEEHGYVDIVVIEDEGLIEAWGDLAVTEDLKAEPAVRDVIPVEEGRPITPDLGVDATAPTFSPEAVDRAGDNSLHEAGSTDSSLHLGAK